MRGTHALGLVAALLAATLALSACGAGAGPGLAAPVSVRVTTGFGNDRIGSHQLARTPSAWSDMVLTRRFFALTTSDGGGFVDAIDGYANDDSGGSRIDWFFYVNGVQATAGAAATRVHAGDRVWWDLHDWQAAQSIPAVVGSFPEPFADGIGGHRLRTRVLCGRVPASACAEAQDTLRRVGARFAPVRTGLSATLMSSSTVLSVIVGPDVDWAGTPFDVLSGPPSASGVYARFLDGGRALGLEDPAGRVVDVLHGAVGLIAAIQPSGSALPTWLITGTTPTGVAAAARDFTTAKLADHFAVAVLGAGTVLPLPAGGAAAHAGRA